MLKMKILGAQFETVKHSMLLTISQTGHVPKKQTNKQS